MARSERLRIGQGRRRVGRAGGHRVGRGLAEPDGPQQRQQMLVGTGARVRTGRH
jgi:hypothetical protein